MRLYIETEHACKSPEPNQLWANFLEARGRALDTLSIDDAARAGRAWAAFLASYTVAAPPLAPRGAE
jgi:hypothetical protein